MTFEMIVGALPGPGESADPGKPNTLPTGAGPDPASRVIHASPRLAVSLAAIAFGFNESSFVGQDHGLGAITQVEFGEDAGDVSLTVASETVRASAISVLDWPRPRW